MNPELANALSGAATRLKKVEVKDKTKPELLSKEEEAQRLSKYVANVREADIDTWYEALAQFTYASSMLPLSPEQARQILQVLESQRTIDDCAELLLLEKQLDEQIRVYNGSAFVKLSSRSPKDAAAVSDKAKRLYQEALAVQCEGREPTANDKIIAFNRAHIKAMCVHSGREALQLLCASGRIEEDIKLSLDALASEPWRLSVVVREWKGIPVEYELRGFVSNKRLTALSQYYYGCCFRDLVKNKDLVVARIERFFKDELLPVLPFNSMVVDFAVDLEHDRVWVIEVNPFKNFLGCGTDAALFSWEGDSDVLVNGRADGAIETRFEHAPPTGYIAKSLEQRVNNFLGIKE